MPYVNRKKFSNTNNHSMVLKSHPPHDSVLLHVGIDVLALEFEEI
jgi:hypothetical protein